MKQTNPSNIDLRDAVDDLINKNDATLYRAYSDYHTEKATRETMERLFGKLIHSKRKKNT